MAGSKKKPDCYSNTIPLETKTGKDGKPVYTVSIGRMRIAEDEAIEKFIRGIEKAIESWNKTDFTGTGIKFEFDADGDNSSVEINAMSYMGRTRIYGPYAIPRFEGDSTTPSVVVPAGYVSNGWYSDDELGKIIAHELSHLLGLDDITVEEGFDAKSIMVQGKVDNPDSPPQLGPKMGISKSDLERTRQFFNPETRDKECKAEAEGQPGLAGGGTSPDPITPRPVVGGGGSCSARNFAYCSNPGGDRAVSCDVYNSCGQYEGTDRCTHEGGGQWDCGKWGLQFFPLEY